MGDCRCLWFVGPGQVALAAEELPLVADGEVLVRSELSGISSGTEQLAYRGLLPSDLPVDETLGALGGTFSYPFRYGYSCVGVVQESRSALQPGEQVFAFHPHQDRFVIGADDVIPIGSAEARLATMFPLVETGLQIALEAAPPPGSTVVVFGLGAVGTITSWLLARAAAQVIAVDPVAARRDAATIPGVDGVEPDAVVEALAAHDVPDGVDLVIEASGNPQALRAGLELLAHEGTALVASWYGAKEVTLPLGGRFHRRRLTIRSTQVSTIPRRLQGDWDVGRRRQRTVELLGELPLERLATHTFAFEEAAEAFRAVSRDPRVIHAALGYR